MHVRNVRGALLGGIYLAAVGCSVELSDANAVEVGEQNLYAKAPQLWPQGAVQACWENPKSADTQARGWVASAVQQSWERYSNVRFTGWGQCASNTPGIHIRVADETEAPHTSGGLGNALNGKAGGMTLNFTFKNWETRCATTRESCIRSIAVHEFGHVLGFAHEQNRPDTPTCKEGPKGNYGDMLFGPWDLSSVMNYCNPNWNNGGVLSATDIAGVRALYGTRKLENFGFNAGSWHAEKHLRSVADVNDDGRDDVVGFGDQGVWVATSNGSGFDAARLFIADFGYDQGWRIEQHVRALGDVNGDGRSDVVAFGNEGTFVSLSGSDRFYPWTFLNDLGYNSGWRVEQHVRTLADVDGDGRADAIGFGNAGVYVALSQGASFAAPQRWVADFGYDQGWRVDKHVRLTADLNDDGRADIVGFGEAGVWAALSTGNGFSAPQLFTSEFGYNSGYRVDRHPRYLADVNADGRDDIVAFADAGVYVALSGSVRFYASQLEITGFNYNAGWRVDQNPRTLADVTGDGRPDVVGYANAGVFVSTALGGQRFSAPELWALRYGAAETVAKNGSPLAARDFPRMAGDWDGDGSADLIGFAADGVHTTDLKLHLAPGAAKTALVQSPSTAAEEPEGPRLGRHEAAEL